MRQPSDSHISSDELHNQNCFDYLQNIMLPNSDEFQTFLNTEGREALHNIISKIRELRSQNYDKKQSFGDLLTQFLKILQDEQENMNQYRMKLLSEYRELLSVGIDLSPIFTANVQQFDDFIDSIYNNQNQNIQRTYQHIEQLPETQNPISKTAAESSTQHFLRDPFWKTHNKNTPAKEENVFRRMSNILAITFMPQINGTNLPNQTQYRYAQNRSSRELRFGTQAQRVNKKNRVAPSFMLWLQTRQNADVSATSNRQHSSQATDEKKPPTMHHVYINKLKLGHAKGEKPHVQYEREVERGLSKALHQIEETHDHVAVITLPADGGLMHQNAHRNIEKTLSYNDVFTTLMNNTTNARITKSSTQSTLPIEETSDFYISSRTKEILFHEQITQLQQNQPEESIQNLTQQATTQKYTELLQQSFQTLGFTKDMPLSVADQQAIWFHFINFELTHFILQTLNPQTFNISCKDAIDRGAVSSVYLNLISSFQTDTPLTRDEFEQGLQAPAAMVKARGMNHHVNRLWNVIDKYVNANLHALENNDNQRWLVEWRDMNCPPKLAGHVLSDRLKSIFNDNHRDDRSDISLILHNIQSMYVAEIGDEKLLLTIFAMTNALASTSALDQKTCERYTQLAKQIPLLSSHYRYLSGLMLCFVGWAWKMLGDQKSAQTCSEAGIKQINESYFAGSLRNRITTLVKQSLLTPPKKDHRSANSATDADVTSSFLSNSSKGKKDP